MLDILWPWTPLSLKHAFEKKLNHIFRVFASIVKFNFGNKSHEEKQLCVWHSGYSFNCIDLQALVVQTLDSALSLD